MHDELVAVFVAHLRNEDSCPHIQDFFGLLSCADPAIEHAEQHDNSGPDKHADDSTEDGSARARLGGAKARFGAGRLDRLGPLQCGEPENGRARFQRLARLESGAVPPGKGALLRGQDRVSWICRQVGRDQEKVRLATAEPVKGRKERIGKIYQMHANKREERDNVGAGMIVAVMGLKDTTTGETLCDPAKPVVLESMDFPAPVISVAIEPKTKGDQEKLGVAIQRLSEEDPTFHVKTDEETGQTIIAGMGELHLEILVDRMRREFKVEANVGKPQVAYRETLRKAVARHDYTHKKQTGGSGQFAKIQIAVEPLPTGEVEGGYEFVNKVTGGRVPREYIPSVDAGCKEGMAAGPLAGYPITDVRVTLLDGAYHDVDSSELAFKVAGIAAFKEAAKLADPAILEPVMKVEVVTPEDFMGDVIGDINSRRGQIQAMDERSGARVVRALVPLSEMFGYVGDLRSRTQGRASYSMEFDSYAEVPGNVAKEIIAKVRGE